MPSVIAKSVSLPLLALETHRSEPHAISQSSYTASARWRRPSFRASNVAYVAEPRRTQGAPEIDVPWCNRVAVK